MFTTISQKKTVTSYQVRTSQSEDAPVAAVPKASIKSKQSNQTENAVLNVTDKFSVLLGNLCDSLSLPNASQGLYDAKIRTFIMKESSFASYDPLRECKHDSLVDKEEHIATVCLIASDKVTVSIVLHSGLSLRKKVPVLRDLW